MQSTPPPNTPKRHEVRALASGRLACRVCGVVYGTLPEAIAHVVASQWVDSKSYPKA